MHHCSHVFPRGIFDNLPFLTHLLLPARPLPDLLPEI
jgi:hypothetical protein